MPIYEFFCSDCNMIFNFFSRSINTRKKPKCPKCKKKSLSRQMSVFAVTGAASEESDMDDFPIDEGKMEKAMQLMAREADQMNEDDPRQAADMMRKLTDVTGMELGAGMQEALSRMERGEDPEKIEAEMGNLLEDEDPFVIPGKKGKADPAQRPSPVRDDTLYDL